MHLCAVWRENRCLVMQKSERESESHLSMYLAHRCNPFWLLIIRTTHGKVTYIIHPTAFVVTGPIIKHSQSGPLLFHFWFGYYDLLLECREKKSVWMRISVNSSNQVKMSVCHIKDNGRNPLLAPSCCTHVWNYPQGKIFACKRTLLASDVIDCTNYTAKWTGFSNQTLSLINWTGIAVGGTACLWVRWHDREARALVSSSLLNDMMFGW